MSAPTILINRKKLEFPTEEIKINVLENWKAMRDNSLGIISENQDSYSTKTHKKGYKINTFKYDNGKAKSWITK